MRYPVLAAILLLTSAVAPSPFLGSAHAQISKQGQPASAYWKDLGVGLGEVPLTVLAQPNIAAMKAEDALSDGALRYGAVIATELGVERDGRWDQLALNSSDVQLVWRMEIQSPGAYSLGLVFDQYELPASGQLFVYSPDRRYVFGAFDASTRQPNGMLAVRPMPGDRIVIEYVQDLAEPGTPKLRVGKVIHDYRDLTGQRERVAAQAAPACAIDVNCSPGDDFQDAKRAVVQFSTDEGISCTGVLLNNSGETAAPYLMTAGPCGDLSNVVAVFDYENNNCNGGGAVANLTVSGATLLAVDFTINAQLYALSSKPPESYAPYYAGWTRWFRPKGPTVSINHPSAGPKKIAVDVENPSRTGHDWSAMWDQGALDSGSIGGPLFEKRGLVLGVANRSINQSPCATQTTKFSRFNQFWSMAALATWLDPLGRNPVGIVGFDPFIPVAQVLNGTGVNPRVFSSNLPRIGTVWTGTVKTSGHPGAVSSLVFFYAGNSSGTFASVGEVLVNLFGPHLLTITAPVIGSTSIHTLFIPNDPSLRGGLAFAQAIIFGGGYGEATNSIKLRIN